MEPQTQTADTDHDELKYLDPNDILADDNIRYEITPASVEELKQQIREAGRVSTPIEVEELPKPVSGKHYRLTVGFRRHQAVVEMNKEEKADLLLPAVVSFPADGVDRLKRQISENLHRRNLSPMDTATSIKKLLDAGVPRVQIRDMFPRAGGVGRKGMAVQPASNAFVNMTLSFLDLPKDIRAKIHDGRVGVAAAYELTKVSPDKRAAVLQRAEDDRQRVLDKEDSYEKSYLATEAKIKETKEKEEATVTAIETAQAEVEIAQKTLEAKQRTAIDAYNIASKAKGDEKAKATEKFKGAETDAKEAEKRLTSAQKALEKAQSERKKLADVVESHRKKLEEARKPKPGAKKGKAVGAQDVRNAAAEGQGTGVKLNAAEMRSLIEDLAREGEGNFPKVVAIGKVIKAAFDGGPTPGQVVQLLGMITGEVAKVTEAPKAAAQAPANKAKPGAKK